MRIYISCDMEGITGIPDWDYAMRDKLDYGVGRELMVGEVNSAIEGALAAGAKEIIVNDSHASMINLIPEKVHKSAKIIQGIAKPLSMMQGIDFGKYDAALFLGYHAQAGTNLGIMGHTYSGAFIKCEVNGKEFGEFGLNSALCGYFNVPVVFVSGDEGVCKEAKKHIPQIETMAGKKGFGKKVGLSLHPAIAREKIKAGVINALKKVKTIPPFKVKSPVKLKVELSDVSHADLCTRIPNIIRLSGRELLFKHKEYLECFKAFLCIMSIA